MEACARLRRRWLSRPDQGVLRPDSWRVRRRSRFPVSCWEPGCMSLEVEVLLDVGLQPVEPDGGGPDQVEQRV
jgi:hypothetical protein